jgi:hypothetical protein
MEMLGDERKKPPLVTVALVCFNMVSGYYFPESGVWRR